MFVRDRMTVNPVVIKADASIADALAVMKEKKVRRLPVLDAKGKLVGIVSEKDLLYASPSPSTSLSVWEINTLVGRLKVESVMAKKVLTVAEDMPIEEAARLMAEKKIGGLPVVKNDKLVGIVTETDLFRAFVNLLGGYREGVRLAATTSGAKGTVAKIAQAVFAAGGDIVGLGFSDDKGTWKIGLKVQGLSKDKLVEAVKPTIVDIIDVR